ncbi:hypothetical protein BH20ACI1_BH20ACI1_09360 [soil metagenome]
MRKLALTNLLLFLAVNSVSACELSEKATNIIEKRLFYDNILFNLSFGFDCLDYYTKHF